MGGAVERFPARASSTNRQRGKPVKLWPFASNKEKIDSTNDKVCKLAQEIKLGDNAIPANETTQKFS